MDNVRSLLCELPRWISVFGRANDKGQDSVLWECLESLQPPRLIPGHMAHPCFTSFAETSHWPRRFMLKPPLPPSTLQNFP